MKDIRGWYVYDKSFYSVVGEARKRGLIKAEETDNPNQPRKLKINRYSLTKRGYLWAMVCAGFKPKTFCKIIAPKKNTDPIKILIKKSAYEKCQSKTL